MSHRNTLPRNTLPHSEFKLSDLPDEIPNYSGDLKTEGNEELPTSVHLAFAIAITTVDDNIAFADAKRDALDALAQAWRAVATTDVRVEYGRQTTSVDKLDPAQPRRER